MIGFAFCGSFCTHAAALEQLARLRLGGREILPIMSENVYSTSTRFGTCEALRDKVTELCGCPIVHTIVDAEPLGPRNPMDALIICPCTGNTLAKLACGITDTTVTMAAKAHLRCSRPLVIALASNDVLSANLKNMAQLMARKNIYFVPLLQDDPIGKPYSMVADLSLLEPTLDAALEGKQFQRVFM